MAYVVHYATVSDDQSLLDALRPLHKAHVDKWDERLHLAALYADDEGGRFHASVFILSTDSRAEAERFSDEDPYYVGGVFEARTIARFLKRRGWRD